MLMGCSGGGRKLVEVTGGGLMARWCRMDCWWFWGSGSAMINKGLVFLVLVETVAVRD